MVCKAERNQLNTGTLCMWRWQLEQAVFYTEVQKVWLRCPWETNTVLGHNPHQLQLHLGKQDLLRLLSSAFTVPKTRNVSVGFIFPSLFFPFRPLQNGHCRTDVTPDKWVIFLLTYYTENKNGNAAKGTVVLNLSADQRSSIDNTTAVNEWDQSALMQTQIA